MKYFARLIMAAALLTGCASHEHELLIGTYTSRGGDGIYSARFDERTGELKSLQPFASMVNPSYLCLPADPSAGDIYAVSETNDGDAHVAHVGADGQIISEALTGGEDPCYISTNGRILLSANYTGGSLSVFKIGEDGSLVRTQLIHGAVGGPDMSRQNEAHVHCCLFSPDGKKVLASDFSADRVLVFDVQGDSLRLASTVQLESDCGPRHILFGDDDKVYVIGELSGNVSVFNYNGGEMIPEGVFEADPAHSRSSADIRLSPDGKFLYASNRNGQDGVAVFSVGEGLTYIDYTLTAANPRNIALSPEGKYLLVGSQNEDMIEVYPRDPKTGLLSEKCGTLHVPMPVCMIFR